MADLQVCYFCGTGPDDSLGEYAVVPPDLEPTDDQQRSVVLCPGCREKLTTVMEPVVDAAEAYVDADGGDATAAGGARPVGGSTTSGPGGDADGESEDAGDEASVASSAGDTEDTGGTDDGPSDPAATDESATTGDDETDGVDVPPAHAAADDDGESDDAPGDDGVTVTDDDGATSSGDDDDGPPADSQAPRDQPHADDELVGRNNEAYNKTLRLLQNREFPVERHEIEQVAANAYQLDPQEVSDAIDALISKGLLTQEGAQLVRP